MTKGKESVRKMERLTESRSREPKDCGREPERGRDRHHFPKEHAFSKKSNQDAFIYRRAAK